jgi:CRISPR system Cascade subunit CasE
MAFPDDQRLKDDPFFLGSWGGAALAEPKPKRSEAGFLFRIERDGNPRILVQSVQPPNWRYAFQNAPYLLTDEEPPCLPFEPTPRCDRAYRFRLLTNVVRSSRVVVPGGKTRTTRAGATFRKTRRAEVPIHPDPIPDLLPTDPGERQRVLRARWDSWRLWLEQIAANRGFRVINNKDSPLLMETAYTRVRNRNGTNGEKEIDQRYNAGLFQGILICTDPDKLRDAIISGIGPAKAFGFGLLSLARATQ